MCAECDRFGPSRRFSIGEFEALHEQLYFDGIATGRLKVVVGSLKWDDVIECLLECTKCVQRFDVICETYHGRGGQFKLVSNDRKI